MRNLFFPAKQREITSLANNIYFRSLMCVCVSIAGGGGRGSSNRGNGDHARWSQNVIENKRQYIQCKIDSRRKKTKVLTVVC